MLARVRERPGESLRTMVTIDTSTAYFDTATKLRLYYGTGGTTESRYDVEQTVGHRRHCEPLGK